MIDKLSKMRCFLCLTRYGDNGIPLDFCLQYNLYPCVDIETNSIFFSGYEKKGVFCSQYHADLYNKECRNRTKYECRKCNTDRLLSPVYCKCGSNHVYCSENHKKEFEAEREGYLCSTCRCSGPDGKRTSCYYGHQRCLKCCLRGRCRICEATPWCSYILNLIFNLGRSRKHIEDRINCDWDMKCKRCHSKKNKLVLLQPCMEIFCRECILTREFREGYPNRVEYYSFVFSEYW